MFRFFFLPVWALLLILPAHALAKEVIMDQILVKINDDIITQYDLDEELRPILAKIEKRNLTSKEREQLAQLRKQTLERMVNDSLMAQEIKKYEIVIPDSIIDEEIARIKKDHGATDEEFAQMIKEDGETMESFRTKLKAIIEKQELLGFMVHSKVLVTDSEIEKEYEARREDYVLEKMVELAIIMLPADISAIEVKKRIEDSEMTFFEAAQKYSIGPGKENGGSIGDVDWSDLADDWKESIEGIEPGGVGSPLTVQGKEALLSPVKIVEDRLVPLEEVKDSIFEKLMEDKRETIFEEYFEKLKESSVIIYMD
ncbi:SurA N-terminal domain-containing protein [Pseudodesulfovibrio sp.]|nr:SurA N-terminal domain-containing protein [Pseudodesulfovibrio sp.]